MRINELPSQPNLEHFENGCCYSLPEEDCRISNINMYICKLDKIYIKFASECAIKSHDFIYNNETPLRMSLPDSNLVRLEQDLERAENLPEALLLYPEFQKLLDDSSNYIADTSKLSLLKNIHYLIIHRLQFDRLREIGFVTIPEARFVLFKRTHNGLTEFIPGVVQARIFGTRLWDMYEPYTWNIATAWAGSREIISRQVKPLFDKKYVLFFDWNPMNFLFNSEEATVYYVDSKPTLFGGKRESEQNLKLFEIVFGNCDNSDTFFYRYVVRPL